MSFFRNLLISACLALLAACGAATPPAPTPIVVSLPANPTPTPIVVFIKTATPLPPTPTATVTPLPPTATAAATKHPPTATATRTAAPSPTPTPSAVAPAVASISPTVAAPSVVALVAGVELSADERKMMALLNTARAKAGLAPLTMNPTLMAVARARGADMAARNYYSHYDPVTHERAARALLLKLGITMPTSENFYANIPYNDGFADRAMNWFMSDPPHRRNILLAQWNVVGVGIVVTSGGIAIATQEFGQR